MDSSSSRRCRGLDASGITASDPGARIAADRDLESVVSAQRRVEGETRSGVAARRRQWSFVCLDAALVLAAVGVMESRSSTMGRHSGHELAFALLAVPVWLLGVAIDGPYGGRAGPT